jgi:Na+/melibiose symporter-like transporter
MRPLVVGSAWWCAGRLKEAVPLPGGTSSVLFKGLRQTFRNRPFMILLIAYTISAIGNNLPATLILSGIGFGATLALPSSIQADVIDYDELLTGERREGQYIGLWSISKKMAAAVGVGVGLAVLGAAGCRPSSCG